ncbi:uroporphyrinogen-III synthase [Ornithobacterium rhinotracheale]|uniref:Uroporphyrinogen-III synthase n=1 Tax=Ornithobacterium rhinotracheale TaxID=28251 RepID=A0A410JTL7_ORNRH|nr:uroporphyrinogen-III synthase [Ornithobacterium rhinotracheale]QAR31542.1 uroporphyrinogen-III synthase [Ornithobacterium rhinotracheale]
MLKILLTKKLSPEVYQSALPKAQVDSMDFISTEYFPDREILAKIENETDFIVSSLKAAQWAIKNQIKGNFYCVGEKSRNLLSKNNPVLATAGYAEDLVQIIQEKYNQKRFCFLCSDIRLDTIPDTLKSSKILLTEVPVYRTRSLAPPLEAPYNAYAFFSPSGVKSFFKTYKIPNNSFIFALGDSTKNSLESFTENRIFTPENPKTQDLIYLIKRTLYAQK